MQSYSHNMSQQYSVTWSSVLIKQHHQLTHEIEAIYEFIKIPSFSPILLDAKIKRLIKGVKLHLELENRFLTPALVHTDMSQDDKQHLHQGYVTLHSICDQMMDLVRSFVLSSDEEQLRLDYCQRVRHFLQSILSRLNDEDATYAMLEEPNIAHV